LAGRTKLAEKASFEEKVLKGEPFGRAVWMADQHEQIVGGRFVHPCLEFFHDKMDVICLGLNKFGDDPGKLASSLERFNCFVNGDFSKFDLHASPRIIRRAFDILRHMHNVPRETSSPEDRQLNWLEDQFIYSHIVLPTGKVVVTTGGIPSGSCLTSLIGTLVNAVLWFEALHRVGITDYSLKVSGDDNYVGFNVNAPSPEGRKRIGRGIVKRISVIMEGFGFSLSPEKTKIGAYLFVSYCQPRVPEEVRDKSSGYLARYWKEEEKRVGRPLRFIDKYEVLRDEPIGPAPGATHRWSYLFHHSAPFLSHYFKRDRSKVGGGRIMMIRPTHEVVENLVHPESRVRDLDDHLSRLQCALVENLGNHHVTNHVMHYVYDAFLLKKAGVKRFKDLFSLSANPIIRKRGWYRKIDRVVDLQLSDLEFDKFWGDFLSRAKRVHSMTFGSHYVDWQQIRQLRRGRFMMGGGIGLGGPSHVSQFSVLDKNRSLYDSLGAFALSIHEHPDIRGRLFESFLDLFGGGEFNAGDEVSIETRRWLENHRRRMGVIPLQ